MVAPDGGATIYACDMKKAALYRIENNNIGTVKYFTRFTCN